MIDIPLTPRSNESLHAHDSWNATRGENNEGKPKWFYCEIQKSSGHYAIIVRQFFFEVFGKYWIGHQSQHLPAPLEWLQWSAVKMRYGESWCRRLRYRSGDEFKAVRSAFASIGVVVPRRFSQHTWGANIPVSQKLWYAYILE